MANPRRLVTILFFVVIAAVLGVGGVTKIQAINAKKKADSTSAAASKAPSPARPDSAGFAFGAGAAIPVVGAEVKRMPLIIWVSAMSVAASSHMVPVNAEAGGRVERFLPKEFDVVKAGDTVMMLDTTELVFALKSAQNSYNRAEVTFKNNTLSDYLIKDVAIRKEREANARMASGLEEAQLSLTRARLEFAKAATRAPVGGRVANVKVVPGQRVGAGAELLTLIAMDPILVHAEVLQSEVGKLRIGNQARITFGSESDTVYTGNIQSINPMVDPVNRTARVTVTVRNPKGTLIPGMTARSELQSRTYNDKLLVPKKAILQRSEGRNMLLVYTPNKDTPGEGTAEWRYVNLGLSNNEFVEILPGEDGSQKLVEPGEIVLVDGHYTIEHQTPIRLVDKLAPGTKRL